MTPQDAVFTALHQADLTPTVAAAWRVFELAAKGQSVARAMKEHRDHGGLEDERMAMLELADRFRSGVMCAAPAALLYLKRNVVVGRGEHWRTRSGFQPSSTVEVLEADDHTIKICLPGGEIDDTPREFFLGLYRRADDLKK